MCVCVCVSACVCVNVKVHVIIIIKNCVNVITAWHIGSLDFGDWKDDNVIKKDNNKIESFIIAHSKCNLAGCDLGFVPQQDQFSILMNMNSFWFEAVIQIWKDTMGRCFGWLTTWHWPDDLSSLIVTSENEVSSRLVNAGPQCVADNRGYCRKWVQLFRNEWSFGNSHTRMANNKNFRIFLGDRNSRIPGR